MQKSGFPKTEIEKQKISKIIFSKILEMPLVKYLAYIEKSTKELAKPFLGSSSGVIKKKLFYAKVKIDPACPAANGAKSNLDFKVSDDRLEKIYSTEIFTLLDNKPQGTENIQWGKNLTGCTENKIICSINWINTRNRFSLHILKSLLDYQIKYWFSGKESELKPLSLKLFLSLYPLPYLDQTRLSRLIPNLFVRNPQGQIINFKNLFISKKNTAHFLLRR